MILGVMPVPRKRPITLPVSVGPVRSKTKMSCSSTRSSCAPSNSEMARPCASHPAAARLAHHLDRACKLLQNHAGRDVQVRHHDHGFQTRERILWRIRMHGAHGAFNPVFIACSMFRAYDALVFGDDPG